MNKAILFLSLFLTYSFSFSFESKYTCKPIGARGAHIDSLTIDWPGDFSSLIDSENGLPVSAKITQITFGKQNIKNINLDGVAVSTPKGPYFEIKPAGKSNLKEIFIAAAASGSTSTVTDSQGRKYKTDCQPIKK